MLLSSGLIMKISAALFDLDGTLRYSRPEGAAEFRRFASEAGLVISEEMQHSADRWNHQYFANSDDLTQDREAAGEDMNAFWRQHARRFLLALGAEQQDLDRLTSSVIQRMANEYEWEDYVPEDVLPTLRMLKDRGYRLGLVSNRHNPLQELAEQLGFDGHFDLVLTAGEVRSWKPEPGLFINALDRIGVDAEQSVYIGDNYYADVLGARAAGIEPILLDPKGTFPEADCLVIQRIGDLPELLERMQQVELG
jgi:HAD superfamily hydrolase (TIGR01549 family)